MVFKMRCFNNFLVQNLIIDVLIRVSTGVIVLRAGKCPFDNKNILPRGAGNASDICSPKLKKCNPNSIYYSFDGSCNNLKFTHWGQSRTPFNRLTSAVYSDGGCGLRKASDGSALPLPRQVRTTVLQNPLVPSAIWNILFYGFGQFLDHDASLQLPLTSNESCCINGRPSENACEDTCLPTLIPPNDPFYSRLGVSCLELKRSVNTRMLGCNSIPCTQINFATSLFDLSILYGNDEETARELRMYRGGKLRNENSSRTSYQEFPPIQSGSACPRGGINPEKSGSCFKTGDNRLNSNPELVIVQTLFLRMHNILAERLQRVNPHWLDERLYHEARRILIAMYQHIVYNEFVPAVLGTDMAASTKLLPASSGHVNAYDPNLNPQVLDVYEAAAGRVFHSMIAGTVSYFNSLGQKETYYLSNKFFNQQFLLDKNMFSTMTLTYAVEKSEEQDKYVSEEIGNLLFKAINGSFGMDLIAIDINRGRDHGLPTYNGIRKAYKLRTYSKFEDMRNYLVDPQDVERLKSLYKSVNDMDFYVGGLLEQIPNDSTVGPTVNAVLVDAFRRWKYGDRLHYEFPEAKFTKDQLVFIRQASFAQVLCAANRDQKFVYKNSFFLPEDALNQKIRCSSLPALNLESWKE